MLSPFKAFPNGKHLEFVLDIGVLYSATLHYVHARNCHLLVYAVSGVVVRRALTPQPFTLNYMHTASLFQRYV